jgi:hypothetical protein
LLVGGISVTGVILAQQPARTAPAVGSSVTEKQADGRRDFVRDSVCQDCHQTITETYLRTNHHLTSQLPSKESIAGKFDAGDNILTTRDPDLHFRMDAKPSGFYETAVFWQPPNQKTRSERIDFVTGSGEKGQTYLYWRGNQLFQLPVSYWTELNEWVNSPGFVDGTADFERPIVPRCLECHATYFAQLSSATAENVYRKSGYELGISCERCHGAGREHVERERMKSAKSPTEVVASRIVNAAALSRERQVEICAQCHGGIGESVEPAFSYVPGQSLENYIRLQRPDANAAVDVHGNQVALTQRSHCYQNSQMSCTTCHEVHAPERTAAAYSDKCLKCHKESDCGEFAKLGTKIREDCIDCHMPVQESNLIISNLNGKQIKARMRNHWIKVYAAEGN